MWSVGDEEKRAQLAQIALEVRDALGEDRTLLREALKEITGLVPVPEAAREIVPALTLGVGDALKDVLMGSTIRPDRAARLQAGLSLIAAVLAYDHAAGVLGPDGEFAKNLSDQDLEAALATLRKSKLAEAMYAYGRWTTTKGQLGVWSSMSGRAWADVRARLYLPPERLVELTQPPAGITIEPRILVLPDRVIVMGPGVENINVRVRARALGTSGWEKRELYPMGEQTFALAFPEEAAAWPSFEWGVEVSSRFRTLLTAPEGFPTRTFSSLHVVAAAPSAPASPAEREITPVDVTLDAVPDAYCVRLTWGARPGERYAVARDGAALGVTPDGWFEDTAPPSGHEVRYSVTARDLSAEVYGGPATFSMSTADGGFRATAQGTANLLALRNDLPDAFSDRVSGTTDWSLALESHASGTRWTVESSLRGATIDLPAPAGKVAADSVPLPMAGSVPDDVQAGAYGVHAAHCDVLLEVSGSRTGTGHTFHGIGTS